MDLVIKEVKRESCYSRKEQKKINVLVIYFEGKERGVKIGKERAMDLRDALESDDTDDWKGKTVIMYTVKKDAFGKMHDIIRFKKSDKMTLKEKKKLSKELDSQAGK